MRLVIRQGMSFALVGLVAGSLIAGVLARVVSAMLISVSPADPLVYALAIAFTLLVTLVSVAIPAGRALRVDPAVALHWQ